MKLGQNDPCHCGSGRKLKHCHGDPRSVLPGPSPELLRRAREQFAKRESEERERIERFGDIRPPITVENWGKRFVAVRNTLYRGNWTFFPDFLDEFLRFRFGADWMAGQNNLDPAGQHPIVYWRTRALSYRLKMLGENSADQGVRPSGFMAAYFGFAYDLYVVDDNNNLDDRLLERLKNREQFQGARHELFANATCLRASFTVDHEDESDPNKRHVEFIATHKKSGLRVAVEAKSRHRPGVIAQAGVAKPDDQVDFRFSRLLNDAVAKQTSLPLVIFVDTNLPPLRARVFFGEPALIARPSRYLTSIIEEMRKRKGGQDPYNILIFTNIPHYYGKDDEIDPPWHWIAYTAEIPAITVADPEPLRQLAFASELYGNVPNTLPVRT